MSLDLTSASSQHLSNASAATPPILTWPISMCFWGKQPAGTTGAPGLWTGDSTSGFNDITLANSGTTNWAAQWVGFDDGSGYTKTATSGSADGSADDVWNFYGLEISPTTYSLVMGGGGGFRSNLDVAHTQGDILSGLGSYVTDGISIGRRSDSSPGPYWNGLIAGPAMWACKLTLDEWSALAGFGRSTPWQDRPAALSPLFIRPEALKFYAPLRKEPAPHLYDMFGYPLVHFDATTRSAPTFSVDHPNIVYPGDSHQIMAPAAAAPGGGRIMSSLAASGGLAGMGGIAGQGGGLAG